MLFLKSTNQSFQSISASPFSEKQCLFLPDSLYVHGLRVPQSVPGWGGSHDGWRVTAVGLAGPGEGRVVLVRVWSVPVAVVQQQRRICLRGVHVVHGRVHVIHQPLQVDVVVCADGRTVGRVEEQKAPTHFTPSGVKAPLP